LTQRAEKIISWGKDEKKRKSYNGRNKKKKKLK